MFGNNKNLALGLNFENTGVKNMLPADVKAHIARVTADGGTVPEQAKMVSMVKKLIAADLWNSCVFFGLPLGGVKKDGNQFVSKVYDLKANADLVQATGTAQPKYSNGSLLYDGGDGILSDVLISANPIRTARTNITVIFWGLTTNGITQYFFNRFQGSASPANCSFVFRHDASGILGIYLGNGTDYQRKFFLYPDIITNNVMDCYAFTFDGGAMDGAIQGLFKLYKNGIEVTATKTRNLGLTTMLDTSYNLCLSGNAVLTAPLRNASKTDAHQIYNTTFPPEQMLWNYNNIRPEGV